MPTAIPQTATRPFLALTAADLMSTPVRTIPQETSLREAAQLFTQEHISGAPVVDADGRCVGVLSSSDFVSWVSKDGNGKVTHFIAPWGETIDIDESPDDEIRHYMTTQPIMVAPTMPIGDLAQKMVDAHIHRVLVVGDEGQPHGVVTSTDILAAVARSAQRAAPQTEGRPQPRRRNRHGR
jgi:CBS domain-containing membrane protein